MIQIFINYQPSMGFGSAVLYWSNLHQVLTDRVRGKLKHWQAPGWKKHTGGRDAWNVPRDIFTFEVFGDDIILPYEVLPTSRVHEDLSSVNENSSKHEE